MTMGSECLGLNRVDALLWEPVTRASAAASFTADALEFLSGSTRYRGRVRVLIVASFGECVGALQDVLRPRPSRK